MNDAAKRDTKLLEQTMEVTEGIIAKLIRDKIYLDEMQFSCFPRKGGIKL